MYITANEAINARLLMEGESISTATLIRDIIRENEKSVRRERMAEGERYYAGEQEILKKDFQRTTVYDEEHGTEREILNRNNSNEKMVHNYHRYLVDQKVSYILGRDITVSVEGADKDTGLARYEYELTKYTSNERFSDMLIRCATGASNKGEEWIHPYYDKDGHLRSVVTPATGIVAFYDTENQETMTALLRYWSMTVHKNGKTVTRKRAEWWTEQEVSAYEEDEEGAFRLYDVRPHWMTETTLDGNPVERTRHGWGRIPFIRMRNNISGDGDLQLYKGLQDAYNLLSSKSTNAQIDLTELYWMVQGYGGETASAIAKKLQYNKSVSITDPNGKIQAQQVRLDVGERLTFLQLLREDMFHLGLGFNAKPETVGNATNVALKLQYQNLDMKADSMISGIKLALSELFWFITEEINHRLGTAYDSSMVRVDIHKNQLTNDLEIVEMINVSRDLLPEKLLLQKHPFVDDVNQVLLDLEQQRAKERKEYQNDDVPYGTEKDEDEQDIEQEGPVKR